MKKLMLLAMATLVVLSVVGVGTASATRFCSTNAAAQCPEKNRWLVNTPIAGEVATPAEFITNLGTMSCVKSSLGGKMTNEGGGAGVAVLAEIESLSFTQCKLGAAQCTVTTNSLPYASETNWTAGFNGLTKVSAGESGINPNAQVQCGALVNCIFSSPLVELSLTAGITATLFANEIVLARQGPTCPKEAKLKATWELSSPGPLNVTND